MKAEATSVRRKYNEGEVKNEIPWRESPSPCICSHLFSSNANEGRIGSVGRGRESEREKNKRRMNAISTFLRIECIREVKNDSLVSPHI